MPRAEHRGLTKRRTTIASIAVASIVAASALMALKLGVGLATGSLGLISTGIESSGDLIAATLTFFAVRLSGRPADPEHPYGHRRAENLGAKTVMEPMQVDPKTRIAAFVDPHGNMFGLYSTAS